MHQPSTEQKSLEETLARIWSRSFHRLPSRCTAAFAIGLVLCSPLLAQQTSKKPASATVAYFAGGCYWCTEAIFEQAPGVKSVVSGDMAGAETIEVRFDPAKTTYEKLLKVFWFAHDPTEINRQGPDVGRKYRSAIFYVDNQQRELAQTSKAQLQVSHAYPRPIATEITRAGNFTAADEHHQDFWRKNPNNPYIQQWLVPKLKKLGLKLP